MSDIILVGGGDFAVEVHEIADLVGHNVVGYLADSKGSLPLPHLGCISSINSLGNVFEYYVIAIGAVDRASLKRRAEILTYLFSQSFKPLSLVSPSAHVCRNVVIEQGVFVGHGATLGVGCCVKNFSLINTSAVLTHDVIVGERSIIAPCSFMAGRSSLGSDSLLGPKSLVLQGINIGSNVIVSFAASVSHDIPNNKTVLPPISRVV